MSEITPTWPKRLAIVSAMGAVLILIALVSDPRVLPLIRFLFIALILIGGIWTFTAMSADGLFNLVVFSVIGFGALLAVIDWLSFTGLDLIALIFAVALTSVIIHMAR